MTDRLQHVSSEDIGLVVDASQPTSPRRFRMDVQVVHHAMSGRDGEAVPKPVEDGAGEWVRFSDVAGLLPALKAADVLCVQLCSVVINKEDFLPFGMRSQVKDYLRSRVATDAIAKAEAR